MFPRGSTLAVKARIGNAPSLNERCGPTVRFAVTKFDEREMCRNGTVALGEPSPGGMARGGPDPQNYKESLILAHTSGFARSSVYFRAMTAPIRPTKPGAGGPA